MTEANSLARVAFFHQQLKEEKASLKRHCGILQLPLSLPHCTLSVALRAHLLSYFPKRQKVAAERRTRFLPCPTSKLDAVVVFFFNFAFSAVPLSPFLLLLVAISFYYTHSTSSSSIARCSQQKQSKPQTSIQKRKKQRRDSISQSTYSALQQQSNLSRRSSSSSITFVIFFSLRPISNLLHDPSFSSSNCELSLCVCFHASRILCDVAESHKLLR